MKTLITIISIAVTLIVTLALVGCSVRPARPQSREIECFGAAGNGDVCLEWARYHEAVGNDDLARSRYYHAAQHGVVQ